MPAGFVGLVQVTVLDQRRRGSHEEAEARTVGHDCQRGRLSHRNLADFYVSCVRMERRYSPTQAQAGLRRRVLYRRGTIDVLRIAAPAHEEVRSHQLIE